MNNRDGGTISFLAGLLFGGLVGAGIGMLLAPENGEKTREKLKKQGGVLLDKSKDVLEKFNEETVKPTLKRAEIELKTKVGEVTDKIKKAK